MKENMNANTTIESNIFIGFIILDNSTPIDELYFQLIKTL